MSLVNNNPVYGLVATPVGAAGGGGDDDGGRAAEGRRSSSSASAAGPRTRAHSLKGVVARMRDAGMIPRRTSSAAAGAAAPEPGARFVAVARSVMAVQKKSRRESRGVPLLDGPSVFRMVLGTAEDASSAGAEEAKRFDIAARFVRGARGRGRGWGA